MVIKPGQRFAIISVLLIAAAVLAVACGGHALLVLTLSFRKRDDSPRWKEIVESAPGRFTHHLELGSELEIDDQVRRWLQAAWEAAA